MNKTTETVTDNEFVLRLDLGNVSLRDQQDAIFSALRRVADMLEDYPMVESGQRREVRRSFDYLGIDAKWTWQA
ncbi:MULTISPECIES: hypothetical protein [Nocardia]|uniref:hypothetical protein n=1 Tax=Nocardia TaxID=1817 RepID=UPI000BF1B63B|nr:MULTISPECIES: hypothetical protein [Nocardia]MBF6315020.1 hypothetical protein [Nocardia farcinica]MBF6411071.1 hypothetical protein [Nocardia farcinica]PEH74613.1 hypothetical protein CRM89_00225 [Nocardia sp. FDAARGOS_372]